MQFNNQLIDLPNLYQIIDWSPFTVEPEASVINAIQLMGKQQSDCDDISSPSSLPHQHTNRNTYVLVVEEKKLLGIITADDILRLLTQQLDLSQVKVFEVMTQELITLNYSECHDILQAFLILHQHQIDQLPIVNEQGELLGILSESALLQALDISRLVDFLRILIQSCQQDQIKYDQSLQELPIDQLPIVNEQGELLGILSESALLQTLDISRLVDFLRILIQSCQQDQIKYDQSLQELLAEIAPIDHYLPQWIGKQIAEKMHLDRKLQLALEEQKIIEEELLCKNEELTIAREMLELARQRYHNFFEFAPDGYLVTNASGIIQEANQAAASLLSIPQNFLIGKPLGLFIAQQDRYGFTTRLQSSQNLQPWELYIQPRKGSAFPATMRAAIIHNSDGETAGWLWLFSDISDRQQAQIALRQASDQLEQKVIERTAELIATNKALEKQIQERKQVEAALRQSEEKFRHFANNTQVVMWLACYGLEDKTYENIYVNPAYERVWGSSCESLIKQPKSWLDAIHLEDKDRVEEEFIQHNQSSMPFDLKYRIVRPDGEVRWIWDRVFYIPNEAGNICYRGGIAEDITEWKVAEEKIREQAALIDITTDAMLVRDFQHQILFWNKGAELMYGWRADEVMGQNMQNILYSGNLRSQERNCLKSVTATGAWQGELRKITKDGREIIVESRWILIYDTDGQPKSIFSVDTDITEKKQFQAQFFRTQRLESIGTLAGGIAHDINNVLTPILSSAQILKGKIARSEEQFHQLLEIIENNAKRGAALVKQVLSFASGLKGERAHMQIKYLIVEIVQAFKQTFPKSIKFVTEIPNDLWAVYADSTQMHQVLMNLVINACDAMREGGTLQISAANIYIDRAYAQMNLDAKVGHYIMLTVSDTGTGIPSEILDRIFEPFFTTKEIGAGTGLGLSTVRGIIKSHGGFIHVTSEVDRGSKFKIFLPSVETHPELSLDNSEILTGHGELILVVDDETAICEVTTAILTDNNYQTLVAHNGIEAIAIYAKHSEQINTVLMDIIMPEMDGITAIRTMKIMNPQVQIIACSGLDAKHILNKHPTVEAAAILFKPYTAKELLQKLAPIVQGKR